ncbi:hypothetical protein M513_05761 [Trichuris suis]|uniref:Uncharacterized protein n=1 Tax=Trichuris suis TaxID=68888 RepID=A0A085M7T4_9BILA|nr:hypothetical protein M513_05761 [Trichuris suis]
MVILNTGVNDRPRSGRPEKLENEELQTLLSEDSVMTTRELADFLSVHHYSNVSCRLHAMDMN